MNNKKYKRVCECFFSPCHNTETVVKTISNRISKELELPISTYDFTTPPSRIDELNFDENDIVIIGTPVYAGRIPNKILPYVQASIHGNRSLCICAVTFGNRSFDDALGELGYLMKKNGFIVSGGAAVVSEHSFAPELASGRPNTEDINEIDIFAQKIVSKINADLLEEPVFPGEIPPTKYYRPLKENGEPAVFLKAVPVTDKTLCSDCGICQKVCPMGVIAKDPSITLGACIKCQACIKACPNKARFFDNEDFLSHKQYLIKNHSIPNTSAFF